MVLIISSLFLYEKKAKKEIVNSMRGRERRKIELETVFASLEDSNGRD